MKYSIPSDFFINISINPHAQVLCYQYQPNCVKLLLYEWTTIHEKVLHIILIVKLWKKKLIKNSREIKEAPALLLHKLRAINLLKDYIFQARSSIFLGNYTQFLNKSSDL